MDIIRFHNIIEEPRLIIVHISKSVQFGIVLIDIFFIGNTSGYMVKHSYRFRTSNLGITTESTIRITIELSDIFCYRNLFYCQQVEVTPLYFSAIDTSGRLWNNS